MCFMLDSGMENRMKKSYLCFQLVNNVIKKNMRGKKIHYFFILYILLGAPHYFTRQEKAKVTFIEVLADDVVDVDGVYNHYHRVCLCATIYTNTIRFVLFLLYICIYVYTSTLCTYIMDVYKNLITRTYVFIHTEEIASNEPQNTRDVKCTRIGNKQKEMRGIWWHCGQAN